MGLQSKNSKKKIKLKMLLWDNKSTFSEKKKKKVEGDDVTDGSGAGANACTASTSSQEY